MREGRNHPQRVENPSEGGSKRHAACRKEVCDSRNPSNHPRACRNRDRGCRNRPGGTTTLKPQRRHCRNRKSCRKTAFRISRTTATHTRTPIATRTRRTRTPIRRTPTRSMTIAGMIIRLKQPANSVAAPTPAG